jgi:hypothetical protein
MKHITVTVTAIEDARRIEGRIPAVFCNVEIAPPAFGKSYTPTYAELRVWGKNSAFLEPVKKGSKLFIPEGEFVINYNKETQSTEIQIKAKEPLMVPDIFPNINTVILSGRTGIEFDPADPKQRQYRSTASGWIFAEQRLLIFDDPKKEYPDSYNFKTVYNNNAEYRGINYADIIANYLSKRNIPITIKGSLVTEKSEIEGRDTRYYPKVLLSDKQAITVHQMQPIASQNVKPKETKPQSAPTVIAENPWKETEQLPSLAPEPTIVPAVTTAQDTSEPPF